MQGFEVQQVAVQGPGDWTPHTIVHLPCNFSLAKGLAEFCISDTKQS